MNTDFHTEGAGHLDTTMAVTPEVIEKFNWLYDQVANMYVNYPASKRYALEDAFAPVFTLFKQEPTPTKIASNDLIPVIQVLREAVATSAGLKDIEWRTIFRTNVLDFILIHMAACGIPVEDAEARKMVEDTLDNVVEVPKFDLNGVNLDDVTKTGEFDFKGHTSNGPIPISMEKVGSLLNPKPKDAKHKASMNFDDIMRNDIVAKIK